MAEPLKSRVLINFRRVAGRLRDAATAANARQTVHAPWGPREVLAHITLWAVQATEHFAHGLPPLNYSAEGKWGPEVIDTFNKVFDVLAGSVTSSQRARQVGWDAVAREGVTLPLTTPETPELHARVDDAFNAAAVELVKDTAFEDVLATTEKAHRNLYRYLNDRPVDCFEAGNPTYERLLLIIAHHEGHALELERLAEQVP